MHRFLVMGCGSIGRRHIANLLRLEAGEIIAYDPLGERSRAAAADFGARAVGTLGEAWAAEPEVALITAPTGAHMSLALEAAARGCHLFIEKPLADRSDDVPRLLDVIRRNRLVALVACNIRFHPGPALVKRLIRDGAIGRVVAARVSFGQYLPDWHPDEDYRRSYSARRDLGGGVILDGIHEIDYIRWMLGEIETVACFAGRIGALEIDTEDTAAILLRFASGAIGEVHVDYLQRVYNRACHIIGVDGTIRWNYSRDEVRSYAAATQAWTVHKALAGWQFNDMYVDEMRHFLDCLRGIAEPVQTVEAAARVLDIALAARRSAQDGTVISVPCDAA